MKIHFLCIFTLICTAVLQVEAQITQQADTSVLSPDQVFTLSPSHIEQETRQANRLIVGCWRYDGPSVDAKSKGLLAGVVKPVAKGKLARKLKKAFKKIHLTKNNTTFRMREDGTCSISLLGHDVNGTYSYNPDDESIQFRWLRVPFTARLVHNKKNEMSITFDTDRLLALFKLLTAVSGNSTLKALTFLSDNYDDVMVGFKLKK